MQHIDMKHLRNSGDPEIIEVVEVIEAKGLESILTFQYDWCEEIIAQFYSTVHFHNDRAITFCLLDEHWEVSYDQFASLLGFPEEDREGKDRIHLEQTLQASEMGFLYDDRYPFHAPSTKYMKPFYAYFNKIFRKTLAPKDGDSATISGYSRNILRRMREDDRPFDVFDFIWNEIFITSLDPKRSCGYGPYIMYMIEKVTNKVFVKERSHEPYRMQRVHLPPPPAMGPAVPAAPPATRASHRHRSPPRRGTSPTKKILGALKSIFAMCKYNTDVLVHERAERKKNTQRYKAMHRAMNLQPPCSPDGSELEEDAPPPQFEWTFDYDDVPEPSGAAARGDDDDDDEETEEDADDDEDYDDE